MWAEENNQLHAIFKFKDFLKAMLFMQKCAEIMHEMNHHATWQNTYNTVEVWLSTHDAGNIVTEKDHALADKMAAIFTTI